MQKINIVMDKIGVFCSASTSVDERYREAAAQLGEWMGTHGKTLVYGGSHLGLMGVIGHSVRAHGGKLMGMVPEFLEEIGGVEPELDVTFSCAGLADRKDLMVLQSDVLVALPGGIGTLDEVFTTMALHTTHEQEKKIIFLNLDDFWKPVIDFLHHLEQQGMLREPADKYFLVADSVDALTDIIDREPCARY